MKRRPYLVQVVVKTGTSLSILDLKRKLKGSGVEVDMDYVPIRVSPAVFVGRCLATRGSIEKLFRVGFKTGICLFGEIGFDKKEEPGHPMASLRSYWGHGIGDYVNMGAVI